MVVIAGDKKKESIKIFLFQKNPAQYPEYERNWLFIEHCIKLHQTIYSILWHKIVWCRLHIHIYLLWLHHKRNLTFIPTLVCDILLNKTCEEIEEVSDFINRFVGSTRMNAWKTLNTCWVFSVWDKLMWPINKYMWIWWEN